MTAVVLDALCALTWCFEDEARPSTDELFRRVQAEGAVVPPLWHLEVGNILLAAERRWSDEAIALLNRGGGSLVMSLFTHDAEIAREVILGASALNWGRVDRTSGSIRSGGFKRTVVADQGGEDISGL